MDATNKLFKITDIAFEFYLYFEDYGLYLSSSQGISSHGRLLFGRPCNLESFFHRIGSFDYMFWKNEVESFFTSGNIHGFRSIQEIPLATFLTSEYKEWRAFAKEHLYGSN